VFITSFLDRELFFFGISHIIQLTPQQLSAEPGNSASAEGASAWPEDQKSIEGEDPAATGIERLSP